MIVYVLVLFLGILGVYIINFLDDIFWLKVFDYDICINWWLIKFGIGNNGRWWLRVVCGIRVGLVYRLRMFWVVLVWLVKII